MLEDSNSAQPKPDNRHLQFAASILAALPVGCFVIGSDMNFTYINAQAELLLGIKGTYVTGKNLWEIFPDLVATSFFTIIHHAIEGKSATDFEYTSPLTQADVFLDVAPAQYGVIVTVSQNNERKTLRAQQQQEQHRLMVAQQLGHIGYFERNLDSEDLYCSDELYRIHGLPPQSEPMPMQKFINFVHPDDQEYFRQQIKESIDRRHPVQLTNRIITQEGEVRVLHRRIEFLADDNGTVDRIFGMVQDITEKSSLQNILKKNSEVCFELDHDFRIIYANHKAYEVWKKKAEDVIGRWLWDVFPAHLGTPFHETLLQALVDNNQVTAEARCPIHDKWFSIQASISHKGMLVMHLDITDLIESRKQIEANNSLLNEAEEKLLLAYEEAQKTKDQLQSVFDTGLIGMTVMQAVKDESNQVYDFRIEIANQELERETGRTGLEGKLYVAEFPAIKTTGLFDLMLQVYETGKPQQTEYHYRHYGMDKWFLCMFVKMDDGLVATYLDVTANKVTEAKIKELETQKQQEIFRATTTTQEEERRRIAESLHNGIGQLLYAVKINLSQVLLSKDEPSQAASYHAKQVTERLLSDAIKESRRISHELTPAILEDFGLKEAINEICRQFSSSLPIKCYVRGISSRLEKYVEVSIYRIVQELIINIIKHAQATDASVDIEQHSGAINVTVWDNGLGFDPVHVKGKGIGLQTIQNKVKMLNGTVDIKQNNGTLINIKIPYQATETVKINIGA